jgi:hypothetical protein
MRTTIRSSFCRSTRARVWSAASHLLTGLLAGLLLAVAGCEGDRELRRMQAEVNRAASELVVQDAQARRDWLRLQEQLAAERSRLAGQRYRDPIVAQAILQIGGLTLCLLPLVVIARLLWRPVDDPADRLASHPGDQPVFDELLGYWLPLLPGPADGCDGESAGGSAGGPCGGKCPPHGGRPSDLNALIEQRLDRYGD